MNTTTTRRIDKSDRFADNLIPSTWIMDSLRDVRDLLMAEGREHLAAALSACIGGLSVQPRSLIDDGEGFEPTPLELLGISPISGGSPEAYEPTPEDWAGYESAFLDHIDEINQGIELDPSYFTEADARAAGLAV